MVIDDIGYCEDGSKDSWALLGMTAGGGRAQRNNGAGTEMIIGSAFKMTENKKEIELKLWR